MQHIDERFKDSSPEATVEKIKGILRDVGIEVTENWNESGVDNCYSLSVSSNCGVPSSNGKGITEALARASAYGEFIERLQGGLFFYKYQSLTRDLRINTQAYAPDAKFIPMDQFIRDGEWMDYLIEAYPQYQATRESIAELCKAYALTDNDEILTIPFYSLFEKKYVYLPVGFVDQMYATNGCCVGNTREEAWVHALSEMMERHATLGMLQTGRSAPRIPNEELEKYPTVSKILRQIRQTGEFDVDIFDYSIGNGFPVVSTRIISKKTHSYRVNVAADPVFEIAVQRTLTELFQGKNLKNITQSHNGMILGKLSDVSMADNIINQLETSSGLYTAAFFANELTCHREATQFADNSRKSNKELLSYMLDLYRQLKKPVYVRNFSYLGFPCYRFVVPGFSEAIPVRLGEMIPQYSIADECSLTMRNAKAASHDDLSWMLNYNNMIRGVIGRYNKFGRISGIPLSGTANSVLAGVTRAYAAYRLGMYQEAINYTNGILNWFPEEDQDYIRCVNRYLQLKISHVDDALIRSILFKFFTYDCAQKLFDLLDSGKSPYDDHLVTCDYQSCDTCRYADACSYRGILEIQSRVGAVYSQYTKGQDPSEFAIE